MFCIQQKKGSTIWYYSPIAYQAFRGQEFKGKGALCVCSPLNLISTLRSAANELFWLSLGQGAREPEIMNYIGSSPRSFGLMCSLLLCIMYYFLYCTKSVAKQEQIALMMSITTCTDGQNCYTTAKSNNSKYLFAKILGINLCNI